MMADYSYLQHVMDENEKLKAELERLRIENDEFRQRIIAFTGQDPR